MAKLNTILSWTPQNFETDPVHLQIHKLRIKQNKSIILLNMHVFKNKTNI